MRYLAYFLVCSILIFGSCSSGTDASTADVEDSPETTDATDTPTEVAEEEVTTEDVIPKFIEFNPRYTWEECAFSASQDVFPQADLNTYAIWDKEEYGLPMIVLVSSENDFILLSEPDDELDAGSFQVTRLEIPADAGFGSASLSYTYYRMFPEDVDGDGTEEYIMSADIQGMGPSDDGMRPVRFLKSIVFSADEFKLSYNASLTDQYNKEMETSEIFINEPLTSLLNKKYQEVSVMEPGLEKQLLLQTLIVDMGIASENYESANRFGPVAEEPEGTYVVYASSVGAKYFVSAREENGFEGMPEISEDHYPLMIDSYQMTDFYTITSARVEGAEISMSVLPLDASETEAEGGDIHFAYNNEYWILVNNGNKWFPETARSGLQKIQDD